MQSGLFTGAGRSLLAYAKVAWRRLARNGTFLLLVLLYVGYMALYPTDVDATRSVASARFLDYAFGGLTFELLVAGVVLGASSVRGSTANVRVTGPAQAFWGRCLGVALTLALLGLVTALIASLHYGARFGDLADGPGLRRTAMSTSFASPFRPILLRDDDAKFAFEFPARDLATASGVVSGRLRPRLSVRARGAPLRSRYPMRLVVEDEAKTFRRTRTVWVLAGRATRFDIPVPRREYATLRVTVEKIDPRYVVRVHQDDFILLGRVEPFLPCTLRAGLALAFYAATFAAIAGWIAVRLGFGLGFLGGLALLFLMTSLDVVDVTLLDGVGATGRSLLLGTLRTVMPALDEHDVAVRLARGRAIDWTMVFDLGGRAVLTTFGLGLAHGLLPNRRRER